MLIMRGCNFRLTRHLKNYFYVFIIITITHAPGNYNNAGVYHVHYYDIGASIASQASVGVMHGVDST